MLSTRILECDRCRKVVKLYPDLEPDEVFNETFLRVVEHYEGKEVNNLPGLFFIVSKSVAKYLRNGSIKMPEHEQPISELSEYQKALDDYLINNDDEFSQVVEMYLICPNLSKLSKTTGIKRYQLKYILENAKNRIGFEYIRIASADNGTYDPNL